MFHSQNRRQLPHIHNVVLMIPSVEANSVRTVEKAAEQRYERLKALFPTVHIVTIKNIGILWRRKSVLKH